MLNLSGVVVDMFRLVVLLMVCSVFLNDDSVELFIRCIVNFSVILIVMVIVVSVRWVGCVCYLLLIS